MKRGLSSIFLFFLLLAPLRIAAETEVVPVKVLTANVGNADIMNCGANYFFKLCLLEWEKPIRESIEQLQPDIVALQEVFDMKWCETIPEEKNRRKVCYEFETRKEKHQARRLLGRDYTIVCDGRSHFECIGVKKSLGFVVGCPHGEICRGRGGLTHGVPDGCDAKPVAFGIDVEIRGQMIRIVNGHPAAGSEACRTETVLRMFQGYDEIPPLALKDVPTIIMGDMNIDPFRDSDDSPDISAWKKFVGEGQSFYYLSGPAENDPPYPTAAGRTIDHVVTNFAVGSCVTLGEAPDTVRLDGVDAGQTVPEANDHKALFCSTAFPIDVPEFPAFDEIFPSEILDPYWGVE